MPEKPRTKRAAVCKAAPVAAAAVAAVATARARSLPDGCVDVPAGRLAAVVTYLEMTAPPPPVETPPGASLRYRMRHVAEPDAGWYRTLFRAVGQRWLWCSRLRLADKELRSIIHNPHVGVYALASLRLDGRWEDKGLLELDGRIPGEVEIALLGVTPDLIGRGAGSVMLRYALQQAWVEGVHRVHLHTSTLDHPRALSLLQRHGFRAWKRGLEISPDPRVTGEYPLDASNDVPLIVPD
jgi:GNAT superfamily N-acetyltransferase